MKEAPGERRKILRGHPRANRRLPAKHAYPPFQIGRVDSGEPAGAFSERRARMVNRAQTPILSQFCGSALPRRFPCASQPRIRHRPEAPLSSRFISLALQKSQIGSLRASPSSASTHPRARTALTARCTCRRARKRPLKRAALSWGEGT